MAVSSIGDRAQIRGGQEPDPVEFNMLLLITLVASVVASYLYLGGIAALVVSVAAPSIYAVALYLYTEECPAGAVQAPSPQQIRLGSTPSTPRRAPGTPIASSPRSARPNALPLSVLPSSPKPLQKNQSASVLPSLKNNRNSTKKEPNFEETANSSTNSIGVHSTLSGVVIVSRGCIKLAEGTTIEIPNGAKFGFKKDTTLLPDRPEKEEEIEQTFPEGAIVSIPSANPYLLEKEMYLTEKGVIFQERDILPLERNLDNAFKQAGLEDGNSIGAHTTASGVMISRGCTEVTKGTTIELGPNKFRFIEDATLLAERPKKIEHIFYKGSVVKKPDEDAFCLDKDMYLTKTGVIIQEVKSEIDDASSLVSISWIGNMSDCGGEKE